MGVYYIFGICLFVHLLIKNLVTNLLSSFLNGKHLSFYKGNSRGIEDFEKFYLLFFLLSIIIIIIIIIILTAFS